MLLSSDKQYVLPKRQYQTTGCHFFLFDAIIIVTLNCRV